MWYDYIGSEQCGWRLIRKGDVIFGKYNYINYKNELLFSEWLEYAESFTEATQYAIIGLAMDGDFKRINNKGQIVGIEPFPF